MPGPGRISVYFYTAWDLQALLYNFDVNSSVLKIEHRNWITATIARHPPPIKGTDVPPQRTHNMTALICGLASRTGSDALNWQLSKRRAEEVSDAIWRLDYGSLLIETKFGVGEEAARLAGFKDGVEDERWRGVFLRLYDPSKIRIYGPPLPPPKTVERRTYVKLLLQDKPGKMIPMDPVDRRAEGMFQAVRKATQYTGLVENIVDEKTTTVLESWTATEIRIKTSESSSTDAWQFEYLEVWYTWQPFKGERVFMQGGVTRRSMSTDEMNEWINHPLKTYRWK